METESGVYQRALDDLERFYVWVGSPRSKEKKQNWHVSSGIKLNINRPDLVEDLRKVWLATRYKHPGIAAVIEDSTWTYRAGSDPHEIEAWLQETFQVHRTPLTARELWSEEELRGNERLALHVLPNTQEIMVRGPHTHLDGFGYMKVLRSIIEGLADPPKDTKFNDEAKNLQPPLALTCQTVPYSAHEKMRWESMLQNFRQSFPTTHLHTTNPTDPAGVSRSQWLVFNEKDTLKIQITLRKLNIPLVGACQAAVSLAARAHGHGEDKYTSHATFGLYSAREYVRPSINPDELTGPHVVGMPIVVPLHSTFIETAREASRVLAEGKGDKFALAVSPLWTSDIPKVLGPPSPADWPMPADAQLSFTGPVGSHLPEQLEDKNAAGERIECVDFWATLDMVSANIVVPTAIFRGKLTFNLGYNEAYHTEESVKKFLELVGKHFAEGLELELKPMACAPGDEEWLPKSNDDDDEDF